MYFFRVIALSLVVLVAACANDLNGGNSADESRVTGSHTDLAEGDVEAPRQTAGPMCLSDSECKQTTAIPCERTRCIGGLCVTQMLEDLSPCNDGNPCTSGTHCVAGQCTDGVVDFCFDGNPCTADACDPVSGCEHIALNDGAMCDDQDPCTMDDQCNQGSCEGVEDASCLCVEDGDCAHRDDGNLCNGTLACIDGVCRLDASTIIQCPPPGTCEIASCVPSSGLCTITKAPNGALCDDANPCSVDDACNEGTCVGAELGCACTIDDDCAIVQDESYDICQGPLTCVDGYCQPDSAMATTCPGDDNPDDCLKQGCHPITGLCGVASLPDGVACRSGAPCTDEGTCQGGVCITGPPSCDDANPCTEDICDATSGCLYTALDMLACDDGDPCTSGSVCEGSTCVAETTLVCDDLNPCTVDLCVAGASGCEVIEAADGTPCDSVDPCQVGGLCVAGACLETSTKVCETDVPCQVASCVAGEGCVLSAAEDGLVCDDGDPCTTSGICQSGTCATTSIVCDDNNPCTEDSCGADGCAFEPVSDGTTCDVGDLCALESDCQNATCTPLQLKLCKNEMCLEMACEPATGDCFVESIAEDGSPCGGEDACTKVGVCGEGECLGATAITCDDNDPCTTDACNAVTGLCEHSPVICTPTQHTPCALPTCMQDGQCGLQSIAQCDVEALLWFTDFPCSDAELWTVVEGPSGTLEITEGPEEVSKLDDGCELWVNVLEEQAATTTSWTTSAQSPPLGVLLPTDDEVLVRFWSRWWSGSPQPALDAERRVQLIGAEGEIVASVSLPEPVAGWNSDSGQWAPIEVTLSPSGQGPFRLGFVFTSKPSDSPSALTWVVDQVSVHPMTAAASLD